MSLQYQRQKPQDFYIPEICWRCDAPMKIKTIMPSMTFCQKSLNRSGVNAVYRAS